jgi:hypothetical protein
VSLLLESEELSSLSLSFLEPNRGQRIVFAHKFGSDIAATLAYLPESLSESSVDPLEEDSLLLSEPVVESSVSLLLDPNELLSLNQDTKRSL